MYTPWGTAQQIDTIAEGITWVSTASHGGFIITAERRAAMPRSLREFATFAGGNAYEEDCDAAIVIAAFPQHFTAEQVARAVSSIDAGEGRYFKNVQVGDAARGQQAQEPIHAMDAPDVPEDEEEEDEDDEDVPDDDPV